MTRQMRQTTITTAQPLPTGYHVLIDGEDLLWVVTTTGTGPYTSTVRRTPTLRMRGRLAWQWLTRRIRAWWEDRCRPYDDRDTVCPRRATYNGRCDHHILKAVERGAEL